MKTQTVYAWLVVVVAIVVFGVALAPTILALKTHGPHVDPSLVLIGIGSGLLFVGGLLMPGERVGTALREASTIFGPYLPFGRRAYDNPPPPPSDPPAGPP